MSGKYEIDMTRGPILGAILRFSIPLMAMSIIQLLFNATDIIVVGRFAGGHQMAAVGSTTSLYNLLVNLFVGLSTGASVMVARYAGADNEEGCRRVVATSVILSLVCGFFMIILGVVIAPILLRIMGTPIEILPHAVLYMRIIFIGMPILMLYNFSAGILRAVGDTKRPLYFLLIGGTVNVILNLFFVIVMDLGVEGVAIGTIASELLSAILTTRCLVRDDGPQHLDLRGFGFDLKAFKSIMRIGLPIGLQSIVFSISNVMIQSSVNSFGADAVAGSAAAQNIEGFVYASMNSVSQASISFTSQNYGAGNYKRILNVLWVCLAVVTVVGVVLGVLVTVFSGPLLSIYSDSSEIISYGAERLLIAALPYFICGIMEVFCGTNRGMGLSIIPTFTSLLGSCALRVVWIMTVFKAHRTFFLLLLCYPISWTVTAFAHAVFFMVFFRRLLKKGSMYSSL